MNPLRNCRREDIEALRRIYPTEIFHFYPPPKEYFFMKQLLLFGELSPQESLINTISLIAIALLAVVALIICVTNKSKTTNTNAIAFGGLCIAASFVLSFVKLSLAYGGSITLASMVPLFIYCYVFGVGKGLLVGIIYGLLQFIQGPYFLSVPQFLLDYILPFASVAVAGVFKKFMPKMSGIICGAVLYSVLRLAFHVASGIIFFNLGWVVESLPLFGDTAGMGGFIYSLIYNAIYMVPETALLVLVLVCFAKSKQFNTLEKFLLKAKNSEEIA